jgi:antitoxin (DNA-binding transcriptional repressor) of toxin-antitoxin stability system
MRRAVLIAELEARLSDYLHAAQNGDEIVIQDGSHDIARLGPIENDFRTIPAKAPFKSLDELAGIQVADDVTPELIDKILRDSRMDYYAKWIASKPST